MRKVNLEDWSKKKVKRPKKLKIKKCKRPRVDWKLQDSILYIKMRNEYLKKIGILVKIGARNYKLNVQN